MASFAVVSLLVGMATWQLTGNAFRHTLDERLRDELVALKHADDIEGRDALIADIVAFDAIPGNGRYLLNDSQGSRLAGRVSVTRLPEEIGDTMLRAVDGHMEPARVVRMTLQDGSTLAVVGETAAMDRTERTLLLIAAVGFGSVIVIGVVGGVLSGRSLHRRLSLVDGTAQAIIKGDFTRRMPISNANDEFDQLSTTLNQMLDHIGRLMNSLRHVSADIAHDLRSPLTRLRAKLESALHSQEPETQSEAIADALDRMDEMLGLFATMLRIAEVEAGGVKQWFKPIALAPLVEEILDNYLPAAQDGGYRLETGLLEDVIVIGSEDLIGQLIANLIENCLSHTPQGSRILVSLVRTLDGAIELSVKDNGPGIEKSQHAKVLQRFGRGEASRSRPGHGLGLAMVQSIATAHGADVFLDDARPGLLVRVVFPGQG
ncbi:MAG: HAMP domain-containing sensor histidine kinase [Sphingobium sp.]